METLNPTEYYEIFEISADDSPVVFDSNNVAFDNEQQQQMAFPGRVRVIETNLAIWAVIDGILLVFILSGNILTILAVRCSRRLRSVISNMFILSLAISDMVVGFTLPYHLAFYMGSGLGKSQQWCLLRFFLVILACCISIWNLIAIAVDRYIAIVYPLHYSRYMTKKVVFILLGFGWMLGGILAIIPMFWNNWDTATKCEFDEILPPWYVAGVITPGFAMVWVCMLIVYWRIWREASKQAKQLRSSFTGLHETPSDWKSIQVVLFILGCFSICWLPYFIIACAQMFRFVGEGSPMLYKSAFSLAMANSGINPIIYAWKNSNFRKAFVQLLRCKSPDQFDVSQHSTRSNIHRKSSSIHHQETINGTIINTPPQSALSGHFNLFDETIYHSNSVAVYDEETHSTPKVSHSRRVSLALTHSMIPPSGQAVAIATSVIPGIDEMNEKPKPINLSNNGVTTKNFKCSATEISNQNSLSHEDIMKTDKSNNGRDKLLNDILSEDFVRTSSSNNDDIIKDVDVDRGNGGNITGNGGRNVVMKQVETDGNGNTQISILDYEPISKDSTTIQTQQQQQQYHRNLQPYHHHQANEFIGRINFLRNSKSSDFDKIHTKVASTNAHDVIIEQLSNGNHIISSVSNYSGQTKFLSSKFLMLAFRKLVNIH